MSQLIDRLERDLREIADGAHPSRSAWDSIAARLEDDGGPEVALTLAPAPADSKRGVWLTAAAAALIMVVGTIAVLDTRGGDEQPISTDTSVMPSSTAVALDDFPPLTVTFVSPRNGFSVQHPEQVSLTPAQDLWESADEQSVSGVDVVDTGVAAVFQGASMDLPGFGGQMSLDEFLDEYVSRPSCGTPLGEQAEVVIDGRSGKISECPNQIQATVVASGRIYLFTLLHDRSDARAVFDAFAATITLTPFTAVDVPNLTTTFVSPTNGLSFKYPGRGLAPATKLWEPGSEQADDDGFDVVETGLSAYLRAASTVIPDGVSVDELVDQIGGCRAPSGQQAEIIIDGQSGTVSECYELIEATVVAGGRLYLFTLAHARSDGRDFFDAWVATIDLRPEAAAVP